MTYFHNYSLMKQVPNTYGHGFTYLFFVNENTSHLNLKLEFITSDCQYSKP